MRLVKTTLSIFLLLSLSSGWIFRSYYSEFDLMERTKTNKSREIIRKYYPDRTLQFEGEYHRGRPDGISKEFYQSGTKKAEVIFRNGREHGRAVFYYPTGVKKAVIMYDKGKIEETYQFDSTGVLIFADPPLK